MKLLYLTGIMFGCKFGESSEKILELILRTPKTFSGAALNCLSIFNCFVLFFLVYLNGFLLLISFFLINAETRVTIIPAGKTSAPLLRPSI